MPALVQAVTADLGMFAASELLKLAMNLMLPVNRWCGKF